MATLVTADHADLVPGTTWDTAHTGTGDTPLTSVGGGTRTIRTDTYGACVEMVQTSGTLCNATWVIASGQKLIGGRIMLKTPTAWGSSALPVMGVFAGSTVCHKVVMAGSGAPGQIRLTNTANANAIASGSGVLTLDAWHRIEWLADLTAGVARLTVTPGDGASPSYDSGNITSSWGTSFDRVIAGNNAATPGGTYRLGRIRITDTAALPGPVAPPTPTGIHATTSAGQPLTVTDGAGNPLALT